MEATIANKPINTTEDVRRDSVGIPKELNGQIPFIVYIDYVDRRPVYGTRYLDPQTKCGSEVSFESKIIASIIVVERFYL